MFETEDAETGWKCVHHVRRARGDATAPVLAWWVSVAYRSWLFAALLLGCTQRTVSGATAGGPTPAVSTEDDSPQSPQSRPPPEPEPPRVAPPPELGWGEISRPTKLARKANREALALHRAGNYADARIGFVRAVEESPGHDLARFNLACALARLGRVDEAAAELSTLLKRDLLRFQPRWQGEGADPDLEALRDSKHAQTLDALIERLRLAYDEAHELGIPAYAFRYRPLEAKTRSKEAGGTDDNTVMVGGMDWLVAGIYLPQARRFVPLTRGGNLAWLDLPNRRVVHASTGWSMGWHGEEASDPTLSVHSTAPDPSSRTQTISIDVDEKFLGFGESDTFFADSHELAWLPEGLGVFVSHNADAYGATTRLITKDGVKPSRRRTMKSKERMHLLLEGAVLSGPDASFKIDHTVSNLHSPDGHYKIRIRTSISEQGDTGPKPPRTVVTRTDTETGVSKILRAGPGPGWALFGPQGALFVEVGGRVIQWRDVGGDTPEPTLEGIHLTMPVPTQPCDTCG